QAVEVMGGVADKEGGHLSHVPGLSGRRTAMVAFGTELAARRSRDARRHGDGSLDSTGTDGVATDAIGPEARRDVLRQAHDAPLCGRVGGSCPPTAEPCHG